MLIDFMSGKESCFLLILNDDELDEKIRLEMIEQHEPNYVISSRLEMISTRIDWIKYIVSYYDDQYGNMLLWMNS